MYFAFHTLKGFMAKTYTGIGLMSGTSLDGVDLAYCEFQEKGGGYTFALKCAETVPFPPIWQSRLSNLPEQAAEIYAKTHVYFGHFLGRTIAKFIKRNKLKPNFVASHGQTIFHQPHKNFTAQVGDGETMVSYLPCPLVTNFRNKDVAIGGQGAPLVPLGEHYLFPHHRLFLNLGGFSNLTWKQQAFDVSPCNIVLNHLVREKFPELEQEYDIDGQLAEQGQCNEALLAMLNAADYFQQSGPKSLGWEWVSRNVIPLLYATELDRHDLLRTYTEHAAMQIRIAIESLSIQDETLLITGGGRHNRFLMSRIRTQLESLGINLDQTFDASITDFKEAIVFAFLGLRVLTGKTTTFHSVTGAWGDSVGGAIHLPPQGGYALLGD